MNIKQELNDIYKGIYFYSLVNESKETARSLMNIRMAGLLFFYHLGTFILAYKVYLRIYGNQILSVFGIIFFVVFLFILLYLYIINPILSKNNFEEIDHLDTIKKYKKKALIAFALAIIYVPFCGIGIDVIYTYFFY